MNPTPGDVHINAALTEISVGYVLRTDQFIAPRVFPDIGVQYQSNSYWIHSREDWFRSDVQLRAPATETPGGGWRLTSATYFADVYGIHKDIDDQTRSNADPAINLERDATLWVTNQLLLKRDNLWASKFFTTGVWNTDLTGVSGSPGSTEVRQWSDYTNSNPIIDLRKQITTVAGTTGYRPNTLVIGAQVWQALADHPKLLERIQYTQKGMVTEDLLASLLGLDRVIVAYGIQNTAAEGATGSYSYQFGKAALLMYVPPNPGLMQPSAGYTFSWTGYLGAGAMGNRIKNFRMEPIASDRVEGEMAFDMKVISADLGVFFTTVVA